MTTRKIRRGARKSTPWAGWGRLAPKGRERTKMYRKCGKKCFLGTKTRGKRQRPKFPICAKGTCKVNTKGLYSAYIRARQWGKSRRTYRKRSQYRNIASRAKRMLRSRGVKVGK
jgi:hypothetical protein